MIFYKVGNKNKDFPIYEHLLTAGPTDGLQDYYNNLESAAHSESGYSPDGSRLTLERSSQLFAENLQQYQSKYLSLPREKQVELDSLFKDALKSYQQSKQNFAQKLTTFIETAGALGIGIASGGTLAPEVFATLLVAGAASKVAIDKTIEGNDFDGSFGSVLRQSAQGASQFALQIVGPALPGAGSAILDVTAQKTIAGVLEGQPLSPAAKDALSKGLTELAGKNNLSGRSIGQFGGLRCSG